MTAIQPELDVAPAATAAPAPVVGSRPGWTARAGTASATSTGRPRREPGPGAHRGCCGPRVASPTGGRCRRDRSPEAAGGLVRSRWQAAGFRDDFQSAAWRERAADWSSATRPAWIPARSRSGGAHRRATTERRRCPVGSRPAHRRGPSWSPSTTRPGARADDGRCRGSAPRWPLAATAARTLRRRCVRVELHHPPPTPSHRCISWEHSDAALARQLGRIHDIAAEAVAAEQRAARGDVDDAFPPRPGAMCGWCDFAAHCPDGQAASRRQPAWAGLPPELESTVDDVLD